MAEYNRNSDSSDELLNPKRLKTLAFNVVYSGGNTLLHKFVLDNSDPNHSGSAGFINAVLLSMSSEVSVNAPNDEGWSALQLAVSKNNLLMVKKLLDCLAYIDVNTGSALYQNNGGTALHLAAKLGHFSLVQEILKKGANVNAFNRNGETPLHYAAKSGYLDIVKFLVRKCADIHFETFRGETPLHCAVGSRNLETVTFLVSCGADVNAVDKDMKRLFNNASHRDQLAIIEFLLGNGVNVNAGDSSGLTPETTLRSIHHPYSHMYGITPLHYALQLRNSDIVKFFLENGADLKARYDYGGTILHYVCSHYDELDIIEILLTKGCDVNAENDFGKTPLYVAVCRGNLNYTRLLLERGARWQIADRDGWYPLHVAADKGYVEIIKALLDKGAGVHAKNKDGKTPLDLAKENKNQSSIDALQNVR